MGALFAGSECVIEKARAKHDIYNAVYAGAPIRRGEERRERREKREVSNSKTQKLNNKKLPGCAAGGALAASGGIKAAGFGCVSFAAFSAFIEKVMQHD